MKKWVLLIAGVLITALICVYVFIPSTINISAITSAKATRDGTYRIIASKTEWKKWWNYDSTEKINTANDSVFFNSNYRYNLIEAGYYNVLISVQHDNKNITGRISLVQFQADSIGIMCQCSLQATANPVEKIKLYFEAIELKKNMTAVLSTLKAFVEKDENIYGIKIKKSATKDTFLISRKQMFLQEPSMNDVYKMINDLKEYAFKKNCSQTDAPMLNILHDSDKYRVMVALPIDKEIITEPPISFVKMTNGNFMVTKVQGGLGTVQNALQQMQLYFTDYNKTSMAITFQYLVTDRIKEIDTTKWVTEIYAPVL
jgi:hypothetical protein